MDNKLEVITGTENTNEINDEKTKALINFYKAFNQQDINLMREVWLNSYEASMNNPVGGIKRNWTEIKSVYDKIFNSTAKVYVEFYDFSLHSTDEMFLVAGKERGFFNKGTTKLELAIRTSRVFIKDGKKWKQLQHHGSIDNPNLLKTYQQAVLDNI